MKMIYAGSLTKIPDRDSGWIKAFRELDIEVVPYSTKIQLNKKNIIERIYNRFNIGKANWLMQEGLIRLVEKEKPDWVHFRLPLGINRNTVLELKRQGCKVTQYFNDDPFSKNSPFGLNWKFLQALDAYDGHFVYRLRNVESYLKAGAVHVEHLPPAFDPERHNYDTTRKQNDQFMADAAFIGHWEDDWRVDCLNTLVTNGFDVILKGGMWDDAIKNHSLSKLSPITHAFGEEYNQIYGNVIAGLCFFSKINNDTWTERALEIVAVGGVLVCERTDEAQTYFKDHEEAFFFSSIDELIQIIKELKANPTKREQVRKNGYSRLMSLNATVIDRARQVVNFISNHKCDLVYS